ncbi:LysR family transcriptional regulator [Sphingomonas sp. Leaf34]|uniref:LysR family transcriptional regulator n=1 Tax=Sphingomonas sp. Leaf34 TaxID=1736216 RepID=UPI0006F7767C|nr:LysR family transcriptional regulator [Sphingomonas sp. Leaf34]KQN24277.1 LysR family transcriptional regulator [Sphingomonas sp. Leaf34]
MDWDDVRYFLALARAHRLGPAAKLLGQDATTVSRRLQRLERRLQTTLFEQTVAGYALTERGAALLEHAETMEASALGIQEVVGTDAGVLAGPIRLSVSEGFGSRILAPRLAAFTNQYPRIAIDLIASTGFLNPSRREADIAVMLARPKSGPLVARKLTDYHLGLYAHPDHLARSGPIATTADLMRHRLIGYVPDMIYAPELRYLAEIDSRLDASIRSSSIVAQAELIAAGAGCGILPCFIGDGVPGLVRVLPEAVDIQRSFWLVVHRDVRRIARIDRFIAWLDATIGDLKPLMLGTIVAPG